MGLGVVMRVGGDHSQRPVPSEWIGGDHGFRILCLLIEIPFPN